MDNDNGNLLLLSNPRFVDNRLSEDLQFLHRTHIVSLESGLLNICFHQLKCFMSLFAQWFYVKKRLPLFTVGRVMTTQQIRLQSSCFAGHKCLVNTVGFAGHKLSGEYLCKALALLAINVW